MNKNMSDKLANLNADAIHSHNMADIIEYCLPGHRGELLGAPGTEHYRLLSYVSTLWNNTYFIDLGTYKGNSALALSTNPLNHVYSYDLVDHVHNQNPKLANKINIVFKLQNYFDPHFREVPEHKDFILNCPLIMADIDPHEGVLELDLLHWLQRNNYKGCALFDDVYLQKMKTNFLDKIPSGTHVQNLTALGHYTGTIAIDFSRSN
jgi:hypothetical protein